jgi:hypothetical protein
MTMSDSNGHAPSLIAVAAGLGEQTPLLAAILTELRSGALEVSVADSHRRELVLHKFPVTGAKRALVYRTGAGADSIPVAATGAPAGALVLPANQARLGGRIVNSGTNPVILYLTERPVPTSGVPAIYLPGSGAGAWDFRLGNVCWCGNISALGQGGTSTLTIAEI